MKNELWLTWKEPYSRRRYKVGVLSKEEKNYIFKYENPELDAATEKGFKYFKGKYYFVRKTEILNER